jgi:hypothetical protein
MIQANDLRIGNILMSSKTSQTMTVKSINDTFCNCTFKGMKRESLGFNYSELKPIRLTEDWLIRFGFKRDANIDFVINHPLLTILIGGKDTYHSGHLLLIQNGNKIGNSEIKYVHQLQNLYFALTNEELIIKS